jgi:hypothetical protein
MPSAVDSIVEQPLEHEIDPDVQKELLKHPGQWAAITRSTFIAAGDTVAEVLRSAVEAGYQPHQLILHRVPEDGGKTYFF